MIPAYGLIGYPLTHSFSPAFFKKKFMRQGIQATYHPFALEHIEQLPWLMSAVRNLRGLNVTIPYKAAVLPYLASISDVALAVGAVNCIKVVDGLLHGYNTDVTGFARSLQPLLRPDHHHALVLGSGGAALAVAYVLRKMGIRYRTVTRHPSAEGQFSYVELNADVLKTHHLIINTTPVGMYPHLHDHPSIPFEFLTPAHLVYDLIYNPRETRLLRLAREAGASTKNGLEMLTIQAEAGWEIWNASNG
jgi:shikimate dehydrogenase